MNGNLFGSKAAGLLGGLAKTDPFGGGGFAKGVSLSPLGRLIDAARKEGSLESVRREIEEYARYEKPEEQIRINYADRPAGAALLLEQLKELRPPAWRTWSKGEQDKFLNDQLPLALRTLDKLAGEAVPPGAARAGMKAPLERMYEKEEYPKEIWEPEAFKAWAPETQAQWRGIAGAPDVTKRPMTAEVAAEARLSGATLGDVPGDYTKFQAQRTTIFDEIPGGPLEKNLISVVVEGDTAASREPGYISNDWDAIDEAGLKHPFLTDTRTAEYLKVPAIPSGKHKGLVDWNKFSSEAIETASPEDKLLAWSWLSKMGGFTKQQLWYIFFNWFPGKGVAEEPLRWPGWGGLGEQAR